MDEGKSYDWDIFVETCFQQKKRFSVTNTTSVKDLKVLCELEFAIPSDLQVFIQGNVELDNTTTVASLSSSNMNEKAIKTFNIHVVTGLESFVYSCMKGDIRNVTKGIRDKTNQLLNAKNRAFLAAFIAAGARRRELLSLLLKSKEWFVDINKRVQLSQRSLLHAAVGGGDLRCVVNVMVMTRGLDLLHSEDEGHETPLDLSRRLGKQTLVQLLEKYEENQRNSKTWAGDDSLEEKTHVEAISLEKPLNNFGLTSNENPNTQQKYQISESNSTSDKDCQIELKNTEIMVTKLDFQQNKKQSSNFNIKEKKVLKVKDAHSNEWHECFDRKSGEENKSISPKLGENNCDKSEEGCALHETQKERNEHLQQKSKIRFRNSSLKLFIPLRNKNQNIQESLNNLSNETSVERTRANTDGKNEPPQVHKTSPCKETVPKIKIVKNMEELAREHHVDCHAHGNEILSPTTENLISTQRPFSAHSHSLGSPKSSRRLICGRPSSPAIEKDGYYSSQSPPSASGICIVPHHLDTPLSPRPRSWSPSPDLVAKISPILQRKFGTSCDLERPRSGSLTLTNPCDQIHVLSQSTLPVVDCKHLESPRQHMPLQTLSAPNSPQLSRKRLPLKINQELQELHHRFFATPSQGKTFSYRRGSLPGNIWKDRENKDRQECLGDTKHKQGKSFDIWLKEKQEQTARKHAFESAAIKAVEKLADEAWSEIRSHGKTYEQWRRAKDEMKSNRDCYSRECDCSHHGECHKKALKYEEWLKRKDEEDLQREEIMRQEAERHFEENRRKREIESERKMNRFKKN